MRVLDLTDNMLLLCTRQGLLLVDRRGRRDANVERFALIPAEDAPGRDLSVIATFDGRRVDADGGISEVAEVRWEDPHDIYGGKVLEGVARFENGDEEHWRLRAEPLLMRFHWTRQPDRVEGRSNFRVATPCRGDALQFWHTGSGATLANEGAPGTAESRENQLEVEDECELLYYSTVARNCLRMELPATGDVMLSRDRPDGGGLPGPAWHCDWTADAAAVVQLSVSCGLVHAARHFDGRQRMLPANATLDFDHFYARVYLGALPLNLIRAGRGYLAARPMAFCPSRLARPMAGLGEIAWAGEFIHLVDPVVAGALLRDTIQRTIEDTGPVAGLWPEHRLDDHEAALLLLAAGRYHSISGDTAFLAHHVEALRRCALHVLGLRLSGSALPATTPAWEPPGEARVQEPAYTALVHAGLLRLTHLEGALGFEDYADWWGRAARTLREVAASHHEEGGLWDSEHGIFVRSRELSIPGGDPIVDRTFALCQNVIPFWLGLIDDSDIIRRAYDWIDDRYTYANGRGERSLPPGAPRGFLTLLDVYVRHRHGVPGGGPLLGFLLGRAMDGGLPFPVAPFGSYARGGPMEDGHGFAHSATGSLLDSSPYFGIVLGLHYGLEYDHRGWRLGTPNPLPGYPLTRVTHLRHQHARYAVTWQHTGRPGRILLDGKPFHAPELGLTEGDHEVVMHIR